MSMLILGPLVRIAQAFLHAAPTVLVGILVAAILRVLIRREQTSALFGGRSWRQLPQAWGLGMLLPVCSLGAIPIMSELRRAGIQGGTIMAFGLTAPIFNPVSLLYGLSLSRPLVILSICVCSFVIVTIVGASWDYIFATPPVAQEKNPRFPYGLRRILGVGLTVLRLGWNRDTVWMMLGIFGVGLLSLALAPNSLQQSAEHDDPLAAWRMAAIALPAYVTPMEAMVQLSNMFQHGNSIAAAFTLLILGTGMNLGVVAWSFHHFRGSKTLAWLLITIGLVLGMGYLLNAWLYPQGIIPEGHTHAFDSFCRPELPTPGSAMAAALSLIVDQTQVHEGAAVAAWGLLVVGGFVVWRLDPHQGWEHKLLGDIATPPTSTTYGDLVLPTWLVATLGLGGLLAASIFGCFVFYPPPPVVYRDIMAANAEVCSRVAAGDTRGAMLWLHIYEDQLNKLKVGSTIRGQTLSPYQSRKIEELEVALEELEHAMADAHTSEAKEIAGTVARTCYELRQP
jgi:uncharacterized membrane protein YraQ (UPF0718 family)